MKSKLAKNGMITLPAEIRKSLNIKIGDEVGFKDVNGEYIIYLLPKMHQLINQDHMEGNKKLIEEMRRERAIEEWNHTFGIQDPSHYILYTTKIVENSWSSVRE